MPSPGTATAVSPAAVTTPLAVSTFTRCGVILSPAAERGQMWRLAPVSTTQPSAVPHARRAALAADGAWARRTDTVGRASVGRPCVYEAAPRRGLFPAMPRLGRWLTWPGRLPIRFRTLGRIHSPAQSPARPAGCSLSSGALFGGPLLWGRLRAAAGAPSRGSLSADCLACRI